MTLYWYMHWFWITSVFYHDTIVVSSSNIISSTIHSISEESLKVTKQPSNDMQLNSTKFDSISPPIHPASMSTKHKSFKKHFSLSSSPPNIVNSTIVGDNTPVINTNVSNSNNNSELQKYLFSGILNPFNHSNFNDSLMYFEEEHSNRSLISNFERAASNSSQLSDNLSAAGITGITLGCVSIVGIILALSYILYRNRGFNRPQVLNDHCSNLDSSGYIDDTSVRDNSEEMYSLDNDSFLNSLEAMTIQNYWTDTVKHTKL